MPYWKKSTQTSPYYYHDGVTFLEELSGSAEKSTDHLVYWFSYQIRQRMGMDKSYERFITNLPDGDMETLLLLEKFNIFNVYI